MAINPDFLRRNFESLLRENGPTIYTQAVQLSGSTDHGQDLAEKTFIIAYERLAQLKDEISVGTWLSGLCDTLWKNREGADRQTPVQDAQAPLEPDAGPVKTPPESFYLGILSQIETLKQRKTWFTGMPVKVFAFACVVMLILWGVHEKRQEPPIEQVVVRVETAAPVQPKAQQAVRPDSVDTLQRMIAEALVAQPGSMAKKSTAPAPKASVAPARVMVPSAPAAPVPSPLPESNAFPNWKGTSCGITDPLTIVVQTPEEWQMLWKAHYRTAGSQISLPYVDFDRYTVVGIYAGQKPTSGFSVEIVETAESGSVMVVSYRVNTPPPGSIQATMTTQPFHLRAIPKTALPIQFKKL